MVVPLSSGCVSFQVPAPSPFQMIPGAGAWGWLYHLFWLWWQQISPLKEGFFMAAAEFDQEAATAGPAIAVDL